MGGCCCKSGWLWGRWWRQDSRPVDVGAAKCRICEIIRRREDMVYEDEEFYVFRDQFAAAIQHLLVVPKKHIRSVYSLLSMEPNQAIQLLQKMKQLAETSLSSQSKQGNWKLGFHVPPGGSIAHLHLHAFQLPHTKKIAMVKYITNSCFFVAPDTILEHLHSHHSSY